MKYKIGKIYDIVYLTSKSAWYVDFLEGKLINLKLIKIGKNEVWIFESSKTGQNIYITSYARLVLKESK